MSVTFTETVTLVSTQCWKCGVEFAFPKNMMDRLRENHETFYCPNGHSAIFGDGPLERLQREVAEKTAEANRQRDNYFAEQRKHEETQKKFSRLQKRTAAGVCPCCNRTFPQLGRHMQTKHAAFVKEHGVPIVAQTKKAPHGA